MEKYDVVIIGSGLGGLTCGAILSKEGMSVCLLEQHHTIGGCLQSFTRDGYTLDTGMHYVGSLSEGQTMNQIFKYFNILNSIHLRKLDEKGFDVFKFNDGSCFCHAMGYERFVQTLTEDFPNDADSIASFCKTVKTIGSLVSPDIFRNGKISNGGMEYMAMSAYEEMLRNIKNPTLRNVLAGNNGLYAGNKSSTSMYEYSMITWSNIEGAYCFSGGTQHIADAFADIIRNNGGEVITRAKVSKIHLEGNKAEYVRLNDGRTIHGTYVISSLHPAVTLSMLENNTILKKAYFTRINSLKNSYGVFTVYLLLKHRKFKYVNRNYYLINSPDVWSMKAYYKGFNIPGVLLCMQPDETKEYADVITLMTPMNIHQLDRWVNTRSGQRGADYEEFKAAFSEAVTDYACLYFPELKNGCIYKSYTSTPLTYRDFTSTPDGSAYGIIKDYHNPIISHLSAKTKISNLLLTGQNLNVHGCLGTCITAIVTCSELLGISYLTKKIGNA